jgi:hypothetical protein
MRNTTRALAVGVSLAASVLLLQGSALGAGTGDDRGGHTMTFHVVFEPFNYTDLGAPGPSAADVIVFHDQLFQSGEAVGDEIGSCVLVDATGLSNWTIQDSPWRWHSRRERRWHSHSRSAAQQQIATRSRAPRMAGGEAPSKSNSNLRLAVR